MDTINYLLPHWAIGTTDRPEIGAQLCTRDGRKTGNAVIIGQEKMRNGALCWSVLTDAGSHMHLTDRELNELFWPPRWLVNPATAPGVIARRGIHTSCSSH